MGDKSPPTRSSSLLAFHSRPRFLNRLRSMHGSVLHRILSRKDVLAVEVESHSYVLRAIPEVVTVTLPSTIFNPHIVNLRSTGLGSHVETIGVLRNLAR